tara:strand:- start:73 stop:453 length:381 start_codon:yes stop_codon:yes gene_type:complete
MTNPEDDDEDVSHQRIELQSDPELLLSIAEKPNQTIMFLMKQVTELINDGAERVEHYNYVMEEIYGELETVKKLMKMLFQHIDSQNKALRKHGIKYQSPIPQNLEQLWKDVEIARALQEGKEIKKH